jgi:hypothetical protein
VPLDVSLIRSDHVLGEVAPAMLAAGFGGIIGHFDLPFDVHRLAAQVDAHGTARRLRLIVLLFKRHN